MTPAAWGAIGTIAPSALLLITFLATRKHKSRVESQESENSTVTAISGASETLAEAVNVLMQPMNKAIAQLQDREREMLVEITNLKAELKVVKIEQVRANKDMRAIIAYVRSLWKQITEQFDGTPLPPPEDLAHVPFEDDPET